MVKPVMLIAAAALATLTACAPTTVGTVAPGSPSVKESPVVSRPPFETAPPMPSGTPVPLPPERLKAIQRMLAERGVTADAIVVVSSEAVTWRDGSWGCPQPGMMYTQALEEGMHVIVTASGTTYDFRFGRSDQPFICDTGR